MRSLDYSLNKYIIQEQAASFKIYIDSILYSNNVFDLVNNVADQVQTYVFSGLIRNFLLGYLDNRDVDIVVFDSQDIKLPISLLRNVSIRKNKFNGYKIEAKHLTIDIWDIKNTWGILEENWEASADSLINSSFFNFSSILYDYNHGQFLVSNYFCKFLSTHIMEVVYEKNPRIQTCIVNALYYADKYEFIIGRSLREWVVRHYDQNLDYRAAQLSRFNQVLYSDNLIDGFVDICKRKEIYQYNTITLIDGSTKIILRFNV